MDLIQELYNRGIIRDGEKEQLEKKLKEEKKSQEEVLLESKIIDESSLFKIKGEVLSIPLISPELEKISPDVLDLIPEEPARNYKMVPLFKKGERLGVGMVYPENILARNALRFLSRKENFSYQIYLITFSDLNKFLGQYRTLKGETKKALTELGKEKREMLETLKKRPEEDFLITEKEAPVIKMVLVILRHAVEGKASDIHIEPSREKLNIRFRQNGVLHPSLFLPISVHPSIVARIKILANLKIDENRVPQDGRFSAKINDRDVDFRVATFPTIYGEKVVMRVLDVSEELKSFEKMGLTGRNLEIVQKASQNPYGLILASGPTGSGKTTTLYTLLRTLNQGGVNIVTVEDPVEYSIEGVNQSQIKPEIGYDFSSALRQILRQDPNIIMVGEIRDEETASLVIHAALTGHIVLSTLHTNSAVGVIPRLIDMGVRPFLIPSTLRVAISQRLIRVLCEKCKKKVRAGDKVKRYILENLKQIPLEVRRKINITDPLYIFAAGGCSECNLKGYTGRTGLYEVLPITDEITEIILKNPAESLILKMAQKQGMLTMVQEGVLKVLEGTTTIEEIERAVEEK